MPRVNETPMALTPVAIVKTPKERTRKHVVVGAASIKAAAKRTVSSGGIAELVEPLDPARIAPQSIPDRLASSPNDDESFIADIQNRGQLTPIIVRRLPGKRRRYQLVAGSRRLAAARALGRPVQAIVRTLNDERAILVQGVENSARQNLSYIEQALFAQRLEAAGLRRPLIMEALNTNKFALSRLLTLANSVPGEVLEAVGPAPAIGRTRWQKMLKSLAVDGSGERVAALTGLDTFRAKPSDERFDALLGALDTTSKSDRPAPLLTSGGVELGTVRKSKDAVSFTIDEKLAPGFARHLARRLDDIWLEFVTKQKAANLARRKARTSRQS